MKKPAYTVSEARKIGIILGDFKMENGKEEKINAPLNTYPCNSGIVINDKYKGFNFGISISHSVMC